MIKEYLVLWSNDELTTLLSTIGETRSSNSSVLDILSYLCLYSGSTIEGRIDAYKTLTGESKKVPVFVSKNEIYFPIYGYRKVNNCWICYNQITKIQKHNNGVEITFKNEQSLCFLSSYYVVHQQIKRCKKYLMLLDEFDEFIHGG